MNRPLIIGQAPARGSTRRDEAGVLIPFQGSSGRRLRALAGVDNLEEHFVLWNMFEDPADTRTEKGDGFDMTLARIIAKDMIRDIHRINAPVVLLMGRNVEQAFGFRRGEWLKARRWKGLLFIVFPHPSGINTFWNDRRNKEAAGRLLKQIVRAYG